MTAQPLDDYDPEDPVAILSVLPGKYHAQFIAEYEAAVANARRIEGYRQLHTMLRLWRLRSVAYSDPGYEDRRAAVAEAARTGGLEGAVSIEEIVPDWAERLRNRQR